MDVFIRNVPLHATQRQLNDYFKPLLQKHGIFSFECMKMKHKPFAILTIVDSHLGAVFLNIYGSNQPYRGPGLKMGLQPFMNANLLLSQSKHKPDEWKIKALRLEDSEKKKKDRATSTQPQKRATLKTQFAFKTLFCGFWTYSQQELLFSPCYTDLSDGSIVFGRSSVSFFFNVSATDPTCRRMDIPYYTMESVQTGHYANPTISFNLNMAPRMFDLQLAKQISPFGLQGQFAAEKIRLPSLSAKHSDSVGSCFCYQIILLDQRDLSEITQLLSQKPGMPASINHPTSYIPARGGYAAAFRQFSRVIEDTRQYGSMPFPILFQAQKMVANGNLPPERMIALFPVVQRVFVAHGMVPTVEALKRTYNALPYPGPHEDGKVFEIEELGRALEQEAASYRHDGSIYDLTSRHEHLVLIHRVTITPAGTYLNGPEAEVTNRVLRKYHTHTDQFIRVAFLDEDGQRIFFERRTDLSKILHGRFKEVLTTGVKIGGRNYQFLGFSHSSLRSQSCWFMAPFVQDGELIHSKEVIKRLGDFSQIRSPAKCAARIGQAFSDTGGAITIEASSVASIRDVERNSRVFSDGCGTISLELLRQVWKGYALGRGLRPTVLQIRFSGAKGVVSLDVDVPGEMLCLRPSMTKFNSNALDIEICGAAFRPLPLFLNRQFIKILEDLHIPEQVFLDLQADAVAQLRRITLSPVNAAKFLEINHVCLGAKTPLLIRMLNEINLPFQEDEFLRSAVEVAALHQLRELKYRQRIPLEDGVTLYGIMDETGVLRPGEVHIIMETKEGKRCVLSGGRVAITRAPAMHPGDIQVVRAVDVPWTSRLRHLQNCVVFSQHGERDLPSQLSGGDLDGDLFQIIFDVRLIPYNLTYLAADYPRAEPIDIGRQVETEDMTNFFIQFMETDQLGRISTIHQQLADRKPQGTVDPDCIKLAGMASVAVDFSKTGIPVDMSECPKYDHIRPDFMATGPRVLVQSKGAVFDDAEDDDDDDPLSAFEPESRQYRYYESTKVLGKLYRAIDEQQFLADMQAQARTVIAQTTQRGAGVPVSMMQRLWDFVRRETRVIQWRHHVAAAREVRETYEEHLVDLMLSADFMHQPLTEVEVFCGSVLGRATGAQNKRQREAQMNMKEHFERLVTFVASRIEEAELPDERLPRAIACLAVGMEDPPRRVGKGVVLRSWRYVAAAVCLKEVKKFQGGLLGMGDFASLRLFS